VEALPGKQAADRGPKPVNAEDQDPRDGLFWLVAIGLTIYGVDYNDS
jgi:hypothetical protein